MRMRIVNSVAELELPVNYECTSDFVVFVELKSLLCDHGNRRKFCPFQPYILVTEWLLIFGFLRTKNKIHVSRVFDSFKAGFCSPTGAFSCHPLDFLALWFLDNGTQHMHCLTGDIEQK